MAIDNALTVATSVVRDWISTIAEGSSYTIHETTTFAQLLYLKDKETVVTVNLILHNEREVTIFFIYTLDKETETYPLKFEGDLSIKFPIDTIPGELKDGLIKQISNEEERLKNALKVQNLQQGESSRTVNTAEKVPQEVEFQSAQPPRPNFDVATSRPTGRQRPSDMPDFDDEYEILPKNNAGGRDNRDIFPSIGDDDLNPPGLPKHPELKPYLDHGRGIGSGGGMYPSSDHPLFRPGDNRRDPSSNIPGLPSGARYDDPMAGGGPGGLGFDGPAGPNFDGLFGPNSSHRGGPGGPGASGGYGSFGGGF